MTALRAAVFVLSAFLLLTGTSSFSAEAQPPSTPAPQNKPSLLTPIAAQLDQLLNGNKPVAVTPAGDPLAATTTGIPGEIVVEPEETFGTRALSLILNFTTLLATQAAV
ncbi:MAG: hypothetical protein AB7H77_08440, partial [Bdellovibrionales bacterium]